MTVWLTPNEAADHVRLGHVAVRSAIKSGKLPAYRNGTKILLDRDDVDAWIKSQPWEPA